MYDFRDPAGITRAAAASLYIYMPLDVIGAVLRFVERVPGGVGDMVALPASLAFLACLVLIGRWIYRTNANAHAFGTGEMTITPGWAVGWFFIPIANLFKPFQGVKETWEVSHRAGGLGEESATSLLGWWWGLWIVNNLSSGLTVRFGGLSEQPPDVYYFFDLATGLLNLPLCLVLIRLMNRLARAQWHAHAGGVFA